jgi:hypothetical protein
MLKEDDKKSHQKFAFSKKMINITLQKTSDDNVFWIKISFCHTYISTRIQSTFVAD